MALARLDLRGRTEPLDRLLPRPADAGADVRDAVAAIVAEVRHGGDRALVDCTARFDKVAIDAVRVPADTVAAAAARVPAELRAALELAYDRIVAYHAHEAPTPGDFSSGGVVVRHLDVPVERAGLYAPGGLARYPSTVLMCAGPATVAGVAELVLCVPPGPDGEVDDATLAAAAVAGVDEVYRVGGAQAIAAMAYGTESIRPVDVIVGPGNLYVAEAKRQVSGAVGIASAFAGPSEVVVVAGPDTPAELAAVDLVVQAEHGPDGLAWLVTWSAQKADEVDRAVDALVADSPRRAELEATLGSGGYACVVDSADEALAVSNLVAPEHLELMVDDAQSLVPQVRAAGAVFCGPWSPASLGDYLAGPNHVLPTNRSARFASALRADDFRRHLHVVTASPEAIESLGPHVITLAETEGLAAHAESIRLRLGRSAAEMSAGGGRGTGVSVIPQLRPDLRALSGYHSPQVAAEVRLNTNESPYPPPAGWTQALAAALGDVAFHRYPDRRATDLRAALADLHAVSEEEIFCANGSNEVLQCLLLAYGGPDRPALLFEPTYALHRHIAELTATPVVAGRRTDDFLIDPADARRHLAGAAPVLTFVCSPNNPTGRAEPRASVEAMVADAPGLVVVDEAYAQFASWSALDLRTGGDRPGLVVVRTFSKTWAMAAVRLGYLVADPAVVAACEQVALPYHLSATTQLAGRLALNFADDMAERVAVIAEERGRLSGALADLDVDTWASDANFILFRPRSADPRAVWDGLLAASVLIRDCSAWDGLGGCLRVTVGTPQENDRFLDALRGCL